MYLGHVSQTLHSMILPLFYTHKKTGMQILNLPANSIFWLYFALAEPWHGKCSREVNAFVNFPGHIRHGSDGCMASSKDQFTAWSKRRCKGWNRNNRCSCHLGDKLTRLLVCPYPFVKHALVTLISPRSEHQTRRRAMCGANEVISSIKYWPRTSNACLDGGVRRWIGRREKKARVN